MKLNTTPVKYIFFIKLSYLLMYHNITHIIHTIDGGMRSKSFINVHMNIKT